MDAGIVREVGGDLALAVQPRPGDQIEPHLVGEHVADGVEVARVEAVDIGGEAATRSGSARTGQGTVLRLLRQLAKALAAAMQAGFDGRDGSSP